MTVKIVRGVIPQDAAAKNVLAQGLPVAQNRLTSPSDQAQSARSDTIATALRSNKVVASEKVRDPEKAAKLADDLAEAIRRDGSELDHSFLNNGSARTHFVN